MSDRMRKEFEASDEFKLVCIAKPSRAEWLPEIAQYNAFVTQQMWESWQAAWRASALACAAECHRYIKDTHANMAHECEQACEDICGGAGMSKALPGMHYCKEHQGNHSHYAEHNCAVCETNRKLAAANALLREARDEIATNSSIRTEFQDFGDILDRIDAHLKECGL